MTSQETYPKAAARALNQLTKKKQENSAAHILKQSSTQRCRPQSGCARANSATHRTRKPKKRTVPSVADQQKRLENEPQEGTATYQETLGRLVEYLNTKNLSDTISTTSCSALCRAHPARTSDSPTLTHHHVGVNYLSIRSSVRRGTARARSPLKRRCPSLFMGGAQCWDSCDGTKGTEDASGPGVMPSYPSCCYTLCLLGLDEGLGHQLFCFPVHVCLSVSESLPFAMDSSPADKEMLGRSSTGRSTNLDVQDPEALACRRRTLHGKVLIAGLIITVVLGLALGVSLGLTVGRYGRG